MNPLNEINLSILIYASLIMTYAMEDLTAFQRDLLYIILDASNPSGQEIKRNIESYYSQNINHGRLYPNLDELVEMGLILKNKKDDRTNSYEITQKGKDKIVERHMWIGKYISDTSVYDEIANTIKVE